MRKFRDYFDPAQEKSFQDDNISPESAFYVPLGAQPRAPSLGFSSVERCAPVTRQAPAVL